MWVHKIIVGEGVGDSVVGEMCIKTVCPSIIYLLPGFTGGG